MIELQKWAGALLFALILIVGIDLGGDALDHALHPSRPAAVTAAAPEPAPAPTPTPAPAIAAGPDKGSVKACTGCHTFDAGGANRVGPNLHGVVGRDIASVVGFGYSDALKGKPGAWTPESLDAFLADPKGFAAGTKMAYAGEKDAARRAAIIAYLQSLK